jgi:hypothetical protein
MKRKKIEQRPTLRLLQAELRLVRRELLALRKSFEEDATRGRVLLSDQLRGANRELEKFVGLNDELRGRLLDGGVH